MLYPGPGVPAPRPVAAGLHYPSGQVYAAGNMPMGAPVGFTSYAPKVAPNVQVPPVSTVAGQPLPRRINGMVQSPSGALPQYPGGLRSGFATPASAVAAPVPTASAVPQALPSGRRPMTPAASVVQSPVSQARVEPQTGNVALPTTKNLSAMTQTLPPLPTSIRGGTEAKPCDLARNVKEILADGETMRRKAHQIFGAFDRNGDGQLSAQELGQCIAQLDKQLGCKQPWLHEEVSRQLRRFDRDCNGHLDCFEFERLYRNLLLISLHQHEPCPFSRETFVGRRLGRPESHYDVRNILGKGCFGVVTLVVCKDSGSSRCMKTVDRKQAEASGMPMSIVAEEIDKLKTLDHPAILRLFEYYVDEHFIHLVTDVLAGGHLLEVMKNMFLAGKPPTQQWVCGIFEQVCKGIAYAHGKGVMHKDLKLDNMMLDSQDPPQAVVIDVGFAEIFPPHEAETYVSTTKAGTLSTMAPEVIMQNFNYKCDVWSLGCCLYGLLAKRPTAFKKPDGSLEVHPYPFIPPEVSSPAAIQEFMQLQRRGPDWSNFSGGPHVRDLVARMLAFEARRRLSMQEVLTHAWFSTQYHKHEVLEPDQLRSLLSFHHTNALEHAVFLDVASQVPIDQLHQMTGIFESMDRDGSGQLDAAELEMALREAGLDPQLAAQAAQSLTEDGTVEFSTFVAALVQSQRSLFKSHLRDAFNRLDTDGSGFITQDELRQLLEDSHLQRREAEQASRSVFEAFGGCRLIRFQQLLEYFERHAPGQS